MVPAALTPLMEDNVPDEALADLPTDDLNPNALPRSRLSWNTRKKSRAGHSLSQATAYLPSTAQVSVGS